MINIFLISFFLLLLYYLRFVIQILIGLKRLHMPFETKFPKEFISVIVPFRNEAENILTNLSCVENQTLAKDQFEIIYIDDGSEDSSFQKLNESKKSNNIKVLQVHNNSRSSGHKKEAVKYGIENASGEIIVTTDADCFLPETWLTSLVSCFDEHTGFVSGPVEFKKSTKFFKKIQRLEFASLIITGAGLIGINKPIICNGANLAFKKNLFYKVGGYDDNLNLSSGDDEFLMQKIAQDTNAKVKFCVDKNALVSTTAKGSLGEFFQQRKRWASKGVYYKDKLLIRKLFFIYLLYLGIPLQFLLGFIFSNLFFISLAVTLTVKFLIEYIVIKIGTDLLFDKEVRKVFLLTELFQIPYIIIAGIAGLFGNFNWKGRQIKR